MRFPLSCDKPAFAEYTPSLRLLENSFRKAGVPLTFVANILPEGKGKVIFIKLDGRAKGCRSIEGDSPAQAVKDIAEAVRL